MEGQESALADTSSDSLPNSKVKSNFVTFKSILGKLNEKENHLTELSDKKSISEGQECASADTSTGDYTLPDLDKVKLEEDDSSSEDVTNDLITEQMIEEENRLAEQTLKEEKKLKEQAVDEKQMEQCYKRLQHLLSQSTFYSQYLLKRIEEQLEQKRKHEAAAAHKKELQQSDQDTDRQMRSQALSSDSGPQTRHTNKRKASPERAAGTSSKKVAKKSHKDLKIVDYADKELINQYAEQGSQTSKDSGSPTKPTQNPDMFSRTINGEKVSDKQPSLFVGGVLRSYQVEGLEWLKVLYENGINGILGDEMGLGKTIQCIALTAHLVEMGIPGPFLVCAPLSTVPNWVGEFQRFTPKIPVVLYHGTAMERRNLRKVIDRRQLVNGHPIYPIVISSYEIVMRDRPLFKHYEWRYIIIDEGHRIKNFKCKLLLALKQYRTVNRLLLTGTPLQNNLSELWSLLNFLLPEVFDDLEVFESWFNIKDLSNSEEDVKIIEREKEKEVLATIHQILSPFMLRRTKKDVELNLPPKKELLVYAPLLPRQRLLYEAAVAKTIRELLKTNGIEQSSPIIEGRPKRGCVASLDYSCFDSNNINDVLKAIEAMEQRASKSKDVALPVTHEVNLQTRNITMLLRKACNHPYLIEYPLDPYTQDYLVDINLVESCGKLKVLDRMLKPLKERGHKVLIFSQMSKMLDILEDYCHFRDYQFRRLDGSVHIHDRQIAIEEFNTDPDVFIFLVTTRAGGLGINLTSADTVVIYDSDWNPQCDLQAQDRCHRIGQTRPVMIYRLATANTIDHHIIERAQAKRKLEKLVIHQGKFSSMWKVPTKRTLDPKELLSILRSTDHEEVKFTEKDIFTDEELEELLDRSDMMAPKQNPEEESKESSQESSDRAPKIYKVIESS